MNNTDNSGEYTRLYEFLENNQTLFLIDPAGTPEES